MGSTALWYLAAKLGRLVEWFEEKFRRKNPSSRALPGHTLYHFYLSPYSRNARYAVYDLGLDVPFKDILNDEAAYRDLIQNGGKDQSPCLRVEENGKVRWMYESQDIIKYLRNHTGL
jgi:hypothetical protein